MHELTSPAEWANIRHPEYREHLALQALIRAADFAFDDVSDMLETVPHYSDTITITVGGTAVQFYLGPSQYEALHTFVDHLARDHLYTVNYDNLTVKEN